MIVKFEFENGDVLELSDESGWTSENTALQQRAAALFPFPPLDTWSYDPYPMLTVAQEAEAALKPKKATYPKVPTGKAGEVY